MNLEKVIQQCTAEGVELSLNGENLDIAFDDYPSDELIALLRAHKSELIAYIKEYEITHSARAKLTKCAEDVVHTSFGQDMLWFMDSLGGSSARYNMVYRLKVKGCLDIARAERVFQHIITRHEPLRSCFYNTEQGIQAFLQKDATAFSIKQVSLISETDPTRALNTIQTETSQYAFSLADELLLKVVYAKLSDSEGVLFINMHHIASDGWSLGVLINEFKQLYFNASENLEGALSSLAYRYSDYANWQRNDMSSIHAAQLSYWANALQGLPVLHSIPTDRARPPEQSFNGKNLSVDLGFKTVKKLEALAQDNDCTLFMVLHAAFALLLSKYSNEDDIAIGTLLANRTQLELEPLIGFFANTVVLRTDCDDEQTFEQFLVQVKAINIAAQENQDVPFDKVVEHLNPVRSQAHTPLMQVMMAFDNTPRVEFGERGIEFENEPTQEEHALFDLYLKVYKNNEALSLRFNYCTALFDEATIGRMSDALLHLLNNILRNPQQSISKLSCLKNKSEANLRAVSQGETISLDNIVQVHSLFEQQVQKTPHSTAIRFGDHQLSYTQLNARSNQLAHQLRENGVQPDDVVALFSERSLEMVIGIFAILKSGAAYLPLEPSYPDERIEYIVRDSQCKLVLVPEHQKPSVSLAGLNVMCFSHLQSTQQGTENPIYEASQNAARLAYVIYTSGSTGQPKGVMIPHRGIINRVDWMQRAYPLNEFDAVLQKTPFSFDVSVWEFIWPLSVGASLDIAEPQMHTEPQYILDTIKHRSITVVHFVPSMFRHLLENNVEDWRECHSLRHVFCSGEALTEDLVHKHIACNNAQLHNLYGPTEASIDVSFHACNSEQGCGVPIGKAIQNTRLYIADKHLNSLPLGAVGELYIGGDGLAHGYINKSQLTAEAFVCAVKGNTLPERVYKTGDLVRCDNQGNIHYLGRIDNQVKIRGFRIELGEIEQTLMKLAQVSSAVVVCQEDSVGDAHLVAYLVLEDQPSKRNEVLAKVRFALQAHLPAYMVPAGFITISEIPVTANGKLDRGALPRWQPYVSSEIRTAAATETEHKLVYLWSEVLGLKQESLCVNQSFFSLGGHSLNLVKLKSHIEDAFVVDIPTKKLFEVNTIASQAELIEMFLLSQSTSGVSTAEFVEEF